MLTWTRRSLLPLSWLAAVTMASSCGARSELPIPEIDFCTTFSSVAKPTQLDLFLLLDSSGSMDNNTIPMDMSSPTKWMEVTAAIETFVVDPVLEGTGATITFFPETREDVPTLCTSDGACGVDDGCFSLGACWPALTALCLDDEDCADQDLPGNTCVPGGLCQSANALCQLNGPNTCDNNEPCLDVGTCSNRTVCDSNVYELSDPQPLPNSANGIISAMVARTLGGGTPTWPAMQGAIDSASRWLEDNPARKAIVVLATDGLPAACEPSIPPAFTNDFPVDNVVATVSQGAEAGIATFVIGVFNPEDDEEAQVNLDTIAAAGSESPAFVVTTDDNVEQKVLDALLEVQAQATSCVYTAPWQTPDNNNKFEVEVSGDGSSVVVPHRPVANACGTQDGFYFASPPLPDASDVQIGLCPTTCERFEGKPDEITLYARCD